jgi:hypothetical protein
MHDKADYCWQRLDECTKWAERAGNAEARRVWGLLKEYWLQRAFEKRPSRREPTLDEITAKVWSR